MHWVSGRSNAIKPAKASVGLSQAGGNYVCAMIQLGSEQIAGVKTALHKNEIFPVEAGLLGNSVLSKYQVTIDAVTRHVFLEKQ